MSKQHKKAIHRRKKQIANKYIKKKLKQGNENQIHREAQFYAHFLPKVGKSDKTKCSKDVK